MAATMTSLQRVLTALNHQEADRVPFFLFTTMHGAKELGLGIKAYFGKASHIAEGQLRLHKKYGADSVSAFCYAALELEAWGGETIFSEDGPPNSGEPVIRDSGDIARLEAPDIGKSHRLSMVLEATQRLKEKTGGAVPVLGVVISPFSLPVMQLGFEHYLELLHHRPDLLRRLLAVNEEFCVAWANAQLAAGATAICYFDPVSSPSIVPYELFHTYGYPTAQHTLARFQGPTAIHFASGRCLPIIDDIAGTGTLAIGVSAQEDLQQVKTACRGRLAVIGNLNAVAVRHWTAARAEAAVKHAIAQAGPGGGYILADNHGEIPWQVPDEVLLAVSEAVHRWGNYPLTWMDEQADGT